MGIGLERQHSGGGAVLVKVSQEANRYLRGAILGAAKSAMATKDNPFADQYERWRQEGLSYHNARRNVARSLAAVMWAMWKTGNAYRPQWVGIQSAEIER